MTAKDTKRPTPSSTANGASRRSKKPETKPGLWDAPWKSIEDASGWKTTYRGTGQARELTSSLVLELTPEQNAWIDGAAEAAGITPHAVLKQLIDKARTADGGAVR
jgi:hypothetical protein